MKEFFDQSLEPDPALLAAGDSVAVEAVETPPPLPDKDIPKRAVETPPPPPDKDVPKKAVETPPPQPDKDVPKKRQFLGHDLHTLLIAGTAIIGLVVYAVWPDSPPTQAFINDERAPHTEPMSSVIPAEVMMQTEEIRQYSTANREAITVLSGRVKEHEKRLAQMEAQLRALAARPAVQPTAAPSPGVPAPQVKPTTQPAAAPRSPTVVKGWRVHTLYPGMAWITQGGNTWAVQTGDVLQGMTIRHIDVERRVVITDKGDIRQGG